MPSQKLRFATASAKSFFASCSCCEHHANPISCARCARVLSRTVFLPFVTAPDHVSVIGSTVRRLRARLARQRSGIGDDHEDENDRAPDPDRSREHVQGKKDDVHSEATLRDACGTAIGHHPGRAALVRADPVLEWRHGLRGVLGPVHEHHAEGPALDCEGEVVTRPPRPDHRSCRSPGSLLSQG